MENPLIISLFVSGIGLLLLFLALAFLYGLMYTMTKVLTDRLPPGEYPKEEEGGTEERELVLRAAAVAVALARAKGNSGSVDLGTADESPWWVLYHQRHLMRRPGRGRDR